jgi:non-ribosomal peptide synthetase component F
MPMTGASMFWLDTLRDCNMNQSLPLPFDRHRFSNEHRTNRGISVSFDFDQDLSHHFLTYASSNDIKLQHLALATYYAFLFKLTNGEKDLCIGMNIDNRYRDELKSIIGLFENIIPLRCQLDPHWSFDQLVKHVSEFVTNSMKYSYFPHQHLLKQHPNASKLAFLDMSFEFQSTENENTENKIMIGDSHLHAVPITIKISEDEIMSKLDFSLVIKHDIDTNQLSYTINASFDLFTVETVDKIAQRFHAMLNDLFINNNHVQLKKSIYELSLILPDERRLIESMNNTKVVFPSVSCIHHEFICRVMEYPQKLAIELDDQSLTYCELLYYVQLLSLNLLNNHHIIPGEIVCQCVERSLSMVRILVAKSLFILTK